MCICASTVMLYIPFYLFFKCQRDGVFVVMVSVENATKLENCGHFQSMQNTLHLARTMAKVFRTLLYIVFLERCALVRHLNFQAVQTLAVLYALVSECASRFQEVSFVDIVTSKCSKHEMLSIFRFQMCFMPQQPAILHISCENLTGWPF